MRDQARLSGGDVPEELGNHPLGMVISGDLILHRQLLETGNQAPVSADNAGHQTFFTQMVEALGGGVALSGGVNSGQTLGEPSARNSS